jgi:hypothetical protein
MSTPECQGAGRRHTRCAAETNGCPTTEHILRLFSLAERGSVLAHGEVVRVFPPQLTELQQRVLNLLGVLATFRRKNAVLRFRVASDRNGEAAVSGGFVSVGWEGRGNGLSAWLKLPEHGRY